MTREQAINYLKSSGMSEGQIESVINAFTPNIAAMMRDIYMEGVNMTGEYQGCWVRFKNIEKIIEEYMGER